MFGRKPGALTAAVASHHEFFARARSHPRRPETEERVMIRYISPLRYLAYRSRKSEPGFPIVDLSS
jgi:hypothetical protein